MQRYLQRMRSESGSLLVTAAICAAVVSILIGGMLTFISDEYALNLRSHRWTQALHLAETGIELGFAEFNNYYILGQNAFSSSRGWYGGGNTYWCYIPNFTNAAGEVVGSVYAYVLDVGTANPRLFAWGWCTTTPRGPVVYRGVECRLANSARFPAAMVAKQRIDMNGNSVTTDSYNSTDPAKSTNGAYDPAKRQPNGDIASNDTVTNTVDIVVGNANIYGQVLVSPNGTVTMGPNGSIGPTLIESERARTISAAQSNGWLRNDFQVDIPDAVLPAGANSWPALPNTATITSGDYKGTYISNSRIINGNVRIYLTGNSKSIQLTGNDAITIMPGSSLTVYTDGSVDIGGNGVINNSTTPINCQFYGLNTTSFKIAGNGVFVGCVYAPNADLEIKGGGANGDMAGAVVAKSITMTGTTNFHYDESLREIGPGASYDIASWRSYRWIGVGEPIPDN